MATFSCQSILSIVCGMQLSGFSDYALRVLIFLAVSPDEGVSAQLIAERYSISFHHVAKAAQWLAREGYVVSSRGRGGGMALARSAKEISLGEVLRKTESRTQLVECLRGEGHSCVITRGCGLRGALLEAEASFFQSLDKKTLADAVGTRQSIARALQLSPKRASV
jgi:Rrf2 family transcriptional regulator, nitric oxide-sensitive transcriptional repressor